jgi:CRP-like cAMP-binding protein
VRAKGDSPTARQLPTVTAPGYVGEIGLVRGVPRTATVRTREDSVLLRIEGSVFLDALETAPPSAAFIQLTGTRWARTASGSAGG